MKLHAKHIRRTMYWLIQSLVYIAACVTALVLFYVLLIVSESAWYAITAHPVSVWAMVLATFITSLLFLPIVHLLQRWVDKLFYRQRINTLQAIRDLGAGDLARLPAESIEITLLQRMADIIGREPIVLNEGARQFCYPNNAPAPTQEHDEDPVYELTLSMEYHQTHASLHVGARRDGWPVDHQEMENLNSIVRFASMSLEHARLTCQQVQEARLDSLVRITTQLHSHDLKNRLHDLSFLAHHMQSGKLDEEETHRMVAAIRKVVSRMQSVMQRMADPNAPIQPRLKAHNINDLVQTIIDNHLWPEGIDVACQYDETAMSMVDADMVESVMNNLFDNAVAAMDQQGKLYVSTMIMDQHCIEISVCDQGCGIDAVFLKHHLFQLFSTNKESGLGVGLYLSERMIVAHGGQLRAESAGKGKGSTFIIRLPLWQHGA